MDETDPDGLVAARNGHPSAVVALRRSEERFRAVFDQSPLGGVIVDADVRVLQTNRALQQVLGREAEELVGQDALALTHPDDRERCRRELERLFAGEISGFRIEKRFVDRDGDPVPVRLTASLVRDEDGNPLFGIGLAEDIRDLMDTELLLQRTLEAAPDAFIGIDGCGRVTEWNAAAEAMFGWRADEITGRLVVDHVFLRQDRALYQERIEAMSDPASGEVPPALIELVAQRRDGETFPIELAMVVVTVGGEARLRAFVRDITQRRAYERDLTERVLVDPLTGLANRTLLVDRLERALARLDGEDGRVAVFFLDVDRFKAINERLGHSAGDAVLTALAARLQATVGRANTVARHGGDEFIVVCEGVDGAAGAAAEARQVVAAFERPVAIAGHRLTVSVTVGVAHTDDPQASPEILIRDADIAMHQAKMAGGGRVEVFDPAFAYRAARRLDLELELRRALAARRLSVAYQPVVDFDGHIVSLEALARWEHDELGTVSPAEFIPLAEETGLIVDLGAFVLDEACRRLAGWQQLPGWADLTLAVNLSGRQLAEPDLVESVAATLARHDVRANSVCLEITESMLMDDVAGAVDALAALGILLAVDDFGTGYSSLLYLRRFPVHGLKLDRSFVAGMGQTKVDTAIIGSMIDLAHSLDLVAVAEGVETPAQADALRRRGCDLAQGFHWYRPLPAGAVHRLLTRARVAVDAPA